jgi:hypothetical protein
MLYSPLTNLSNRELIIPQFYSSNSIVAVSLSRMLDFLTIIVCLVFDFLFHVHWNTVLGDGLPATSDSEQKGYLTKRGSVRKRPAKSGVRNGVTPGHIYIHTCRIYISYGGASHTPS